MNESYSPRVGDRVRFYSYGAEMNLYGVVVSIAPDAGLATVQEDNEEGGTYLKSWGELQLIQSDATDVAYWMKRTDRAEASSRSWASYAKTQAGLARVAKLRIEELTDRGCWWEAAKTYARANRRLTDSLCAADVRIEELEREVSSLKGRQAIESSKRAEKAETEPAGLRAHLEGQACCRECLEGGVFPELLALRAVLDECDHLDTVTSMTNGHASGTAARFRRIVARELGLVE